MDYLEVLEDMPDVVYELIATVDGEEVYVGRFTDTLAMEETGIRKAEQAVLNSVQSDDLVTFGQE